MTDILAKTTNAKSDPYLVFVKECRIDHKKWLCEKYETIRRMGQGKPPKDFGYGYFKDPSFDWFDVAVDKHGYDRVVWMLNAFTQHHVTFFPNQSAQSKTLERLSLIELRDKIQATAAATKAELPWLKLAVFGDKRTGKNCLRNDANTKAISGIELDYDAGVVTFEQAIAKITEAKLMALLYTSASYKPEKPKWRILLPTSRLLPPGERKKLVARVNGLFGGVFDGACFTLSLSYYFGGVGENPSHRAIVVEGEYIDQRGDLDAGAIYTKKQERAKKKQAETPFKAFSEQRSGGGRDDIAQLFENIREGVELHD